jgi:hypothetical protein
MTSKNPILAVCLTLSTLTACYGAAPPHPASIALPELSAEATINVHSETTTKIENRQKKAWTCPAGHSEGDPLCTSTTYEVAEPVTRTETAATYGADPISYAQFKVLTDPEYDAKVARLDAMRARCRGANKPRVVGMILMLAGAGGIMASAYGKIFAQIGFASVGAGGVSYGFGYYGYGGRTCNEAAALYRELDMTEETEWKSVWGEDHADEMKRLAKQFNDRGHGSRDSLGFGN